MGSDLGCFPMNKVVKVEESSLHIRLLINLLLEQSSFQLGAPLPRDACIFAELPGGIIETLADGHDNDAISRCGFRAIVGRSSSLTSMEGRRFLLTDGNLCNPLGASV